MAMMLEQTRKPPAAGTTMAMVQTCSDSQGYQEAAVFSAGASMRLATSVSGGLQRIGPQNKHGTIVFLPATRNHTVVSGAIGATV